MFDVQSSRKRSNKDEAERPFWISYADLMTALMILFLVVMCVALFNVTKKISDKERLAGIREKEVAQILDLLDANVKKCGGAKLVRDGYVIDFGPQAYFDFSSNKLSPTQERYLRECVPNILEVAGGELGRKWVKRIVVEGYTDQKGGYLINLNLSLQRSQRVLCALLAKAAPLSNNRGALGNPAPVDRTITPEEKRQIRQLFLVGGYSYNSARASDDESRRIEMRLEFWGLEDERNIALEAPTGIDIEAVCPLDGPTPNISATPGTRPAISPPENAAPPKSPSLLDRLLNR